MFPSFALCVGFTLVAIVVYQRSKSYADAIAVTLITAATYLVIAAVLWARGTATPARALIKPANWLIVLAGGNPVLSMISMVIAPVITLLVVLAMYHVIRDASTSLHRWFSMYRMRRVERRFDFLSFHTLRNVTIEQFGPLQQEYDQYIASKQHWHQGVLMRHRITAAITIIASVLIALGLFWGLSWQTSNQLQAWNLGFLSTDPVQALKTATRWIIQPIVGSVTATIALSVLLAVAGILTLRNRKRHS